MAAKKSRPERVLADELRAGDSFVLSAGGCGDAGVESRMGGRKIGSGANLAGYPAFRPDFAHSLLTMPAQPSTPSAAAARLGVKKLLIAVEDEARKLGCGKVTLEVRSDDTRSLRSPEFHPPMPVRVPRCVAGSELIRFGLN